MYMKLLGAGFNWYYYTPTEVVHGKDEVQYVLYSFYSPAILEFDGYRFEVDYENTIILPKGAAHRLYSKSECFMLDWVEFSADKNDLRLMQSIGLQLGEMMTIQNAGSLTAIMMNLCIIHDLDKERYAQELAHILQSVFYSIAVLRQHSEESIALRQKYPEVVQLRRRIYEDPEADWSMETMCEMIHCSKSRLHKIYKQMYDVTCVEDVTVSRIHLAKTLLYSSDMNISEVSDRCGFHSYEHFFRTFRKYVGMTPKVFREQRQQA